jgi:hypothetical protein
MNCRLPQTPRTPAAAASHYFDDVFTRQRRKSLSGTRRNSLARSLTRTRSIGARSDWTNGGDKTPGAASTNGGDEEDGDDEAAAGSERPARQYSIYKEDPAETGPKVRPGAAAAPQDEREQRIQRGDRRDQRRFEREEGSLIRSRPGSCWRICVHLDLERERKGRVPANGTTGRTPCVRSCLVHYTRHKLHEKAA